MIDHPLPLQTMTSKTSIYSQLFGDDIVTQLLKTGSLENMDGLPYPVFKLQFADFATPVWMVVEPYTDTQLSVVIGLQNDGEDSTDINLIMSDNPRFNAKALKEALAKLRLIARRPRLAASCPFQNWTEVENYELSLINSYASAGLHPKEAIKKAKEIIWLVVTQEEYFPGNLDLIKDTAHN